MKPILRTEPLKVVILSPSFGGYGGMESFVIALGDALSGLEGLRVSVGFKLVSGGTVRPELERALSGAVCRPAFLSPVSRVRAVAGADVVHLQNPMPELSLLARLLGRPLVTSMINHRPPAPSAHRWMWDRARRLAVRRLYISEFVRGTWEGACVERGSLVVPPFSRLSGTPRPPERRRGFCFLSRWIPNKGLEELVRAYARSGLDPAQHPLALLGDGPLRPVVEQEVEAAGLRGRVTCPGFIDERTKMDFISGARWMVVPPRTREDFGLTALEARWVGVPCIATRDGGVPEAAGPEALLCEPGDVDGLASRLREAASMPAPEYSARADAAFRGARAALRPAEWYADLYREVAA